jgi:ssDNA-binding Zn-finger/Zn-ribbon topoisomerase 1
MALIKNKKTKNAKNENLIKNEEYQNIPLLCPRCHIVMKKINKNGVTIDYCTKCRGIWLDDKEIDKLTDF